MPEYLSSPSVHDKLLQDDFSTPHDDEGTWEGEQSQHPAMQDAFRLQALLDKLVVTDFAQFTDLVRDRVENLNERAVDLFDLPVTIIAPSADIVRSNAHNDLMDGEVSVNNTAYENASVIHDEDADDYDEPEPEESEEPSAEHADSITGRFGGFAFLLEQLPDSERDAEQYRINLYARTYAQYMESPLASVTVYDAARLSRASIMFDQDLLSEDLEYAASYLDNYRDTKFQAAVEHAEATINNSSFTCGNLQKIDEVCRDLFVHDELRADFSLQDSLVDLMKLYQSVERDTTLTTPVVLQLEQLDGVGRMSFFSPEQETNAVAQLTSDTVDYTFLPRTIITDATDYELSEDTLGLYLVVSLPDEHTGYIPAEYLKHIA